MEKVFKNYMMIRCPLCDFDYLATKGEYKFVDIKVEEAHIDADNNFIMPIYDKRIEFHCPDCDRTLRANAWREYMYTNDQVNDLKEQMKVGTNK